MLFKVALALLMTWLLGVAVVNPIGELVHALLLAGLLLLSLALLKSRDRAAREQSRARREGSA